MSIENLILTINNFLYSQINNLSWLNFYTLKKIEGLHSLLKKNVSLVDNRDSCIICGNGPSLNNFNFQAHSDYAIFTVNFFHKGDISINNDKWFHVLIDSGFLESEYRQYIIDLYDQHPNIEFIFRAELQDIIKTIDFNLSHAHFIYSKLCQYKNKIYLKMHSNMTMCHNTVLMAIQCAIYMGYKKIYLIGCEHNFFYNYSHFYDEEEFIQKSNPRWNGMLYYDDKVFKHHHALRIYSEKNKVEIFNITPNSMLDTYNYLPLNVFYKL